MTYPSGCDALLAGVDVEKPGECSSPGELIPDDGPTVLYESPIGLPPVLTMQVPDGWGPPREEVDSDVGDYVEVLPPANPQTGVEEAAVAVLLGEIDPQQQEAPTLPPEQRNSDVVTLLNQRKADLRAAFTFLGITEIVEPSDESTQKVNVGDVPGAVQDGWKGRFNGTAVDMWVGGITRQNVYVVLISLILSEKRDEFLPKVIQIFLSMRPVPQPLSIPAMDEIAGFTVGAVSNESPGCSICDSHFNSSTYAFSKPGPDTYAVLRTSSFSFASNIDAGGGSSSTETSGSYEIYGNELFMYFSDGQTVGTIEIENGEPTGNVTIGSLTYRVQ